jgi:hypothetical protein
MGTKVVYNACFGGFTLSPKAENRLEELGLHCDYYRKICRHDHRLVQVVEELGEEANGSFSRLAIVELKGDRYRIDEYDGNETVQEPEGLDWIQVK